MGSALPIPFSGKWRISFTFGPFCSCACSLPRGPQCACIPFKPILTKSTDCVGGNSVPCCFCLIAQRKGMVTHMKKRILAIVICLIMCLSLYCIPALAAEAVSYVEYSWNEATGLSSETKTETGYTEVTAETTTWTDGWYVVTGDVTIDSRVTVSGSVSLILTDGCTLNNGGITVKEGNSLTIYGQQNGTGVLNASGSEFYESGIGGGLTENCGVVTIHGGVVNATGHGRGAGIGGGGGQESGEKGGKGGTVTIYHGTVTATGGTYSSQYGGAGIGGGAGYNTAKGGNGGSITIYGGIVNATGYDHAAGIGGGGGGLSWTGSSSEYTGGSGADVKICGGVVFAFSTNRYGEQSGVAIGAGNENMSNAHGTPKFSNCIVFEGDTGKIYASDANHTLDESFTVPDGKMLNVDQGQMLTIPADMALTVDGSVNNSGTIVNNGTLFLRSGDEITGEGILDGSGSWELAVLPEMITVPTDLTYNGKDQTETAERAVGLSDNTNKQTIRGKEFSYITSGWEYTISPATVKDAGTYTVTYSKNSCTTSKTFEVARYDITSKEVTIGEFDTRVYDGNNWNPQATVTIELEGGSFEVPGRWYTVYDVNDTTTFDADWWNEGGNFTGKIKDVSPGMQPKSVEAVVKVEDKYWDGTTDAEISFTLDTGIDNQTITVSGITAAFDTAEPGENKTVTLDKSEAAYTVTRHYNNGDAYPGDPKNYSVTIADPTTAAIKVIPLTISGVAMDAESYIYDGDPVGYDTTALTISQPGGTEAKAEDLVYTYTGVANDGTTRNSTEAPTKAGDYTLTVSHSDTVHYSGSQVIPFAIGRASVKEPVQAEPVTYNGTAQTYTVEHDSWCVVETVTKTNANEEGYEVTLSLLDAANYQWETAGNTNDLTHRFIINRAPVTITAKDWSAHVGTKLPDSSAPELGTHYTVDGLIGEDVIGTVTMKYQKDGTDITPDINKTGTYDIVMLVDNVNPNYELSFVNGKLTYYYIPTYTPTVVDTRGGDVTVNNPYPAQGQTVTITPRPDKGMTVDKVIVTDKNGDPVAVSDNGDGTYSFRQPAGKVTITVTFKPETCPSEAYSDLDTGAWYHEAVDYVLREGLMNGVSETRFEPNGTTTRAMIVTILWRLEGSPIVNYAMNFKDVPAEQWYAGAVRWAAGEKLVEGYSETAFGPNDAITREQLVTILFRYAMYKGMEAVTMAEYVDGYPDGDNVSAYAIPAMNWALSQGVLNGMDGRLCPAGSATRAQAAAILQRFRG